MKPLAVGTGLSHGVRATTAIATAAVQEALYRLQGQPANSLLLFLSPHFLPGIDATLRACARTAACTQILGASAADGVFTEKTCISGCPACAAMAFSTPYRLEAPFIDHENQAVLSFCTDAGLDWNWLQQFPSRIGAVAAGDPGQEQVWTGGRKTAQGRVQCMVTGATQASASFARGVRQLTPPLPVSAGQGRQLLTLAQQPALDVLAKALPFNVREQEKIPLHLLHVGWTFGDPATAIAAGRYRLAQIVATDPALGAVELSAVIVPGEHIFFGLRDTKSAERDMRIALERMHGEVATPRFGLLFSSRGVGFYGQADRDLELFREQFPDLPLLGFYGKGEIAALDTGVHVFQYAAATAVFG